MANGLFKAGLRFSSVVEAEIVSRVVRRTLLAADSRMVMAGEVALLIGLRQFETSALIHILCARPLLRACIVGCRLLLQAFGCPFYAPIPKLPDPPLISRG